MERVELLRGDLAVGVAARRGEGLVQGRVVRHDEVLQAAPRDSEALEARNPGRARFERVARATTFAEGFGKDLRHQDPGVCAGRVQRAHRSNRGESIPQGSFRPSAGGTWVTLRMVRGRSPVLGPATSHPCTAHAGPERAPLLGFATDHAAAGRHRAVLRTPLRASVRAPLSCTPPARPAAASDRARDGGRAPVLGRSHARAQSVRGPPQSGRPRGVRRHDGLARDRARRWRPGLRPRTALHARGSAARRPPRRHDRRTVGHPGRGAIRRSDRRSRPARARARDRRRRVRRSGRRRGARPTRQRGGADRHDGLHDPTTERPGSPAAGIAARWREPSCATSTGRA